MQSQIFVPLTSVYSATSLVSAFMSAPPTLTKSGRLTIVGSGIGSIGQLTLQALAHIKQADIVFYVLADPVTEAFIRKKNPNCVDLYTFYDDGKTRMVTYIQMSEVMLMHLRDGKNVVGVFYGHPGVFVSPSHRTIDIARKEGYTVKMLPGISAEDCLFADLGIDPSTPGCLTYEATDMLLCKKPLIPSSHLILYQVGCVGVIDFNFKGFDNANLEFLLDRLETVYGPEHSVIHYIASILPLTEPTIEKYTIAELRHPDAQNRINSISTFYLPPKTLLRPDAEIAAAMGILKPGTDVMPAHYPSVKWTKQDTTEDTYHEYDTAAKAQIESHVTPALYRPSTISTAMEDLMTKLALDPKALAAYQENPTIFLDSASLTPSEMSVLRMGPSTIISSMKHGYDENAPTSQSLGLPPITAVVVVVVGS